MKTLQEKYNAILEGNFSKTQFVRDARLAHSNLITQFNSFADTVAILKNKGMVVEAKKAEVTAYKKPEVDPIDMIAPDLLDHGIEAELHAAGITGTPSEEEYAKAKEKAAKELIKDPLCYKNAQTMTEPGEKMEKAKLNEGDAKNTFLDSQEKVRNLLRNKEVAAAITAGSVEDSKPFVVKLMQEPENYVDKSPEDIIAAFEDFKDNYHIDREAEMEFDALSGQPDPEIQEAKDLEISPEQMKKLHRDGKITLPDGSVLHYTGTVTKEEDEHQASEDRPTQASIDMTMQQAGMKETQLKEAVKSLIKKTLES